MKKAVIFLLVVSAFCDVSDAVLKIKEIQNSHKVFLRYPEYNIFSYNNKNNQYKISGPLKAEAVYNIKIYAIFNDRVNINGEWKKPGDYIGDYKILKICPDYIVLKKNNKLKTVKFSLNIIKVSK